MSTTEELEHWRLRLVELIQCLKASKGMNQRAVAEQAKLAPDYLSRLLYPEGKKHRKNLGMDTMRKICAGFDLPPNWFDLPLGTALPEDGSAPVDTPGAMLLQETDKLKQLAPRVIWPFPYVTYGRVQDLKARLGTKLGHEAMADIGKTLDVVVTKWEREAAARKSR